MLKNVETDDSHFFDLGSRFGTRSNNTCLQYTLTFKKL